MKKVLTQLFSFLLAIAIAGCASDNTDTSAPESGEASAETSSQTSSEDTENKVLLSNETLYDKIAGSYLAQMVGVTWGASTEFGYRGSIIPEDKVPEWKDTMINDAFSQDDLYVEIPFMLAMKEHGVDCSLDIIGEYFADTEFALDHANKRGRLNLRLGIPARECGNYKNNYHADDIDWQIEADFLGNIYPGMISDAAERAFEIGHITNYGDGVYGGVYVAAMHSAAFTANSLEEVLAAGRKAIPDGTKFASIIDEVTASHEAGDTFEQCWSKIEQKWGTADKCPEYSAAANIDAKLNAAYILIGLLWGEGDLAKTVVISMRCGQDSDCNPSSAAAVLGTLYGAKALPNEYISKADYKTSKFSYTSLTLDDCINLNLQLAKECLEASGAVKSDDGYYVVPQSSSPVEYEQWPDDELTLYLEVENDGGSKVNISMQSVKPASSAGETLNLSFDMGDGTYLPAAVTSYEYLKAGTYTIKCHGEIGGKTADVEKTVTVGELIDRGFEITPSCSRTAPEGNGSRDISVIVDGKIPNASSPQNEQYDTYAVQKQEKAWFALRFDHTVTVTDIVFTEGAHFDNGGWFAETPATELHISGKWVAVESSASPAYAANGAPFATYTFTLSEATACDGVRISGTGGGSAAFASCSELDVKFSAVENPAYKHKSGNIMQESIMIVSEPSPTGAGCKDLEVMRDGVIPPPSGDYQTVQYDTYAARPDDHEDYFGYVFRGVCSVSSVAYTEGGHFDDGGWFKDGKIRLELLVNGKWVEADATVSPAYPVSDSKAAFGARFETYTFTLSSPADCNGIRVIGTSGGSAHFASVSELAVEGVKK